MWDDKKGRLYRLKRAMQCQAETGKKNLMCAVKLMVKNPSES